MVLIAADEYEGLLETVHLLRSPANAARLLAALECARACAGAPQSLDDLRAESDRADAGRPDPTAGAPRLAVFQPEYREDLR